MAGKKFVNASKLVDSAKKYKVEEAFSLVVQTATAKFDETVEAAFR